MVEFRKEDRNMKRKLLAVAVCAAMGMAVCACGKETKKTDGNASAITTTTAPAETTTPPEVTKSPLELAAEGLLVTDYELYVDSTVLPEGYKGVEVQVITEADVDAYIEEVRNANKERVLKDASQPIEETDIAIIDYVGYLDGVAFEGGTAYSHEMEIGNSGFIEGFDEGLIGAKKGDKVSLPLTFPEDYWNEEMAGKDVVFEVTIHSVAAQVAPEFTDEWVSAMTGGQYTTTEDFRLFSKGFLTEEKKYNAVVDNLVDNATFEKMDEKYITDSLEFEKLYYAYMYGFASVEEFEEVFGEEASAILWASREKQIRRLEQERMALYCVAKAEGLTLTESEFTERATEYAESLGITLEALLADQDVKTLRQSMLMESALELLLNSVVEKGAE